jgi:hypothetical protein
MLSKVLPFIRSSAWIAAVTAALFAWTPPTDVGWFL